MPTQVELCDAVTEWLNATQQQDELPETFTARHETKAYIDMPASNVLEVLVTAGDRGNDRTNRSEWQKSAEVRIAVIEKLDKRTKDGREARGRELRNLHEAIEDVFLGVELEGFERNEEVGQAIAGATNEDHVFRAELAMVFTYTVEKSRG